MINMAGETLEEKNSNHHSSLSRGQQSPTSLKTPGGRDG
jgi:hypothetical protein